MFCHIGLQATTAEISSYMIHRSYWKMYHWQSERECGGALHTLAALCEMFRRFLDSTRKESHSNCSFPWIPYSLQVNTGIFKQATSVSFSASRASLSSRLHHSMVRHVLCRQPYGIKFRCKFQIPTGVWIPEVCWKQKLVAFYFWRNH
jgi:hypothetical protein